MTSKILIVAVSCMLLITGSASSTVQVTGDNGAGLNVSYYTKQVLPNGHYVIHLLVHYSAPGGPVYEIHANGGEIIDTIGIDVDESGTGQPLTVRVKSDAPSGVGAVGNIVQTGTAYTLLNRVESNGDLGSALANGIGIIEVGGNVTGDIVATTADGGGITSVTADGNILGNIRALLVRVNSVIAFGSIGTASNPVTIEASTRITQVISVNDLYANIDVNGNTPGFPGRISIVQAQRFFGSLVADEMVVSSAVGQGYIKVFTNLSADIEFRRSFSGANMFMELPLNGLTSQITINSDNLANGTWTAPIKIGPDGNPNQVILSNPGYTQTATSLGGGSVGLVPFHLHDESCTPANGAVASIGACTSLNSIRLRHYGYLFWNSSGDAPATVYRRVACSGTFNQLSNVTFAIDANDARTLIVTAPFEIGYQYKVTPTAHLKCNTTGNPSVVWDADYLVRIRSTCNADITGAGSIPDGHVDVNDLLAVINGWGSCPDPSCCVADIAGANGAVDVDDLLAVINAWGICDGCSGDSEPMPQSIQDCMNKCSSMYPNGGTEWSGCVDSCVLALCEAQIINCN